MFMVINKLAFPRGRSSSNDSFSSVHANKKAGEEEYISTLIGN